MSETDPASGRRLLNATAVMASGTMVSRILGFVRTALLAFVLGNTTHQAEAFNYANTVPTTLYLLLAGGTLNAVLVPQIVRAVTHDEDGGKAFVDRIITGFLLVLGILTMVFTLATPWVMTAFASSWPIAAQQSELMAAHWRSLLLMSYLCIPQLFFYGVFFLVGQVLNARDRFGPMMWAPAVNNIVSIGVLGLYLWLWGSQNALTGAAFTDQQAWLLGLGSTLGIVVQTLVVLPYLRRTGFHYRPRFDLLGTGLGQTFHVAKWMVGYVALTSLASMVVANLASTATRQPGPGAGWVAYGNANLVFILPHSLITVSLATAMLPSASRHAVAGHLDGVLAETNRTLRLAITFLLPASVALVVLADPITRLIYGNGSGAHDYIYVAWALSAFAIGLVPFTIQYVYLRAFYAMDNTRTPFLIQIWISGANALAAVVFVLAWNDPPTVAARLALAYSVSYFLGAFITHAVLRRRLPGLTGAPLWQHLLRLLGASVPAAVLAWLVTWWFAQYPNVLVRALGLALAGLLAVLAFFVTAKRIGIPEVGSLMTVLRRRRGTDQGTPAADEDHGTDPGAGQEDDSAGSDSAGDTDPVDSATGPAESTNPDPDGAGVFIAVEAAAQPPTEVLDYPEADPAAITGRVLAGRYHLTGLLAQAEGTQTWQAHDPVLDRPVLVHLIPADHPRLGDVVRAAREAASATDARFLRVLDVVDATQEQQTLPSAADETSLEADGSAAYLVYEYTPGQALERILRDGPLTGVETAWIAREVSDALIGLHAQGHYHGRLSPASVMITAGGNLKILGFAVAAALAGTGPGTEGGDVRALGGLLYACLANRWPGGPAYGLAAAPLQDGRLVLPSGVRGGVALPLDAVVDRILSTQPRGNAAVLNSAQDVTTELSLVLGPTSAAQDLRARMQHFADGETPVPLSLVAPPVPTPAASRFQGSSPVPGSFLDPDTDPAYPSEETEPFVDAALRRADTFTPVPPPPAAVASPPSPARRSRLPFALSALGLVLAVGLAGAATATFRPVTAPSSAPATAVKVAAISSFDPKADGGSGAENAGKATLAVDGNLRTAWPTEKYRSAGFGGIKPGVGLLLDLGAPHEVSGIEIHLSAPGASLQVMIPDADAADPPTRSVKQWRVIATVKRSDDVARPSLAAGQRTRYLLVYLTDLPSIGKGIYQAQVAEIVVSGT